MLNTSMLIILMSRECSSPHNSYLRNELILQLHFRIYLPDTHMINCHSILSLSFFLNSLRKFSSLMEFHINTYVILVSEFNLALGFV